MKAIHPVVILIVLFFSTEYNAITAGVVPYTVTLTLLPEAAAKGYGKAAPFAFRQLLRHNHRIWPAHDPRYLLFTLKGTCEHGAVGARRKLRQGIADTPAISG